MTLIKDLQAGDTFTLNGLRYTIKERTTHQKQECVRCESENGVVGFFGLHIKVEKDK